MSKLCTHPGCRKPVSHGQFCSSHQPTPAASASTADNSNLTGTLLTTLAVESLLDSSPSTPDATPDVSLPSDPTPDFGGFDGGASGGGGAGGDF